MKKIFLASMMLLAAVTLSAQSIVGKWKSEPMVEDGMNYVLFITFAGDNKTCNVLANFEAEKADMKLTAHLSIPYLFTLTGDQLALDVQKDKMEFKLDELSFTGKAAEELKKNPSMEGMIRSMIEQALNGQKDKMIEDFPLSSKSNVTITDTTLKIDEMVLTRVVE